MKVMLIAPVIQGEGDHSNLDELRQKGFVPFGSMAKSDGLSIQFDQIKTRSRCCGRSLKNSPKQKERHQRVLRRVGLSGGMVVLDVDDDDIINHHQTSC